MNAHLVILRMAAMLTPHHRRTEWLEEWTSELWYVDGAQTAFCLGAFRDALWVRHNSVEPDAPNCVLTSPLRCILLLSALAAISVFFAIGLQVRPKFILPNLLMIVIALLILRTTTSLALGEYPPSRTNRFRRWMFLGVKCALVLPIVFFGTLDLAPLLGVQPHQPHAMLIGYVLAFRWVLTDQRRRCPVCLRLLSNPTRIGQRSQSFVEWYGTEFVCLKGHGLLHVPEITTSYSTQRWLHLDPSWGSLFP